MSRAMRKYWQAKMSVLFLKHKYNLMGWWKFSRCTMLVTRISDTVTWAPTWKINSKLALMGTLVQTLLEVQTVGKESKLKLQYIKVQISV